MLTRAHWTTLAAPPTQAVAAEHGWVVWVGLLGGKASRATAFGGLCIYNSLVPLVPPS